MEFRCVTHEACIETFGLPTLAPWQESYTFVAHLSSDGTRMSYRGASGYRGRAGDADHRLLRCRTPGDAVRDAAQDAET